MHFPTKRHGGIQNGKDAAPRVLRATRHVFCVCLLSLSACTPAFFACGQTETGPGDASRREPAARRSDTAAQSLPVILLTGFEPFGAGRPPNPSWEGIKSLDGRQWNGYRLACEQMKVVWGAPREQLQAWIAEYRPAAVLSFGQGGGGAFAFESVASNERGRIRDNEGRLPPGPVIVAGGPRQLAATVDSERFARSLSEKGYPTRVSSNAGRYLCEETLYTLEHLKATDRLETTVLFCHVPPLGSRIEDKRVDAKFVGQFVEDVLETWHVMYHKDGAFSAAHVADEARAEEPRQSEVEKLIKHYFATWTSQDMEGYGACFMDGASVQFVDSQGTLKTFALAQFLAGQRESHRRARHRQTEVAESIDIRFESELARVVVYWKLTSGPTTTYGYDHFTLMKQRGRWRIANLLFYETKR